MLSRLRPVFSNGLKKGVRQAPSVTPGLICALQIDYGECQLFRRNGLVFVEVGPVYLNELKRRFARLFLIGRGSFAPCK